MTDLLTLAGVYTHVGRYHILHAVDLAVPEGQTTMLLGRNGADKTSTLRTIMGLWPRHGRRLCRNPGAAGARRPRAGRFASKQSRAIANSGRRH